MISIISPNDAQLALAKSLRANRKQRKHSRATAERLTGVPAATIRRYEDTGEISLRQFLMLVDIYGDLNAAQHLFPKPAASSMDELIAQQKAKG